MILENSLTKTKKCRRKTSYLDLVLVHTRKNSPFTKCQFQPLCRLCVEHVEDVAKESALFVHDERSE